MTQLQNIRDLTTAVTGDTIVIDGHTLTVETLKMMSSGLTEMYLTSDKQHNDYDDKPIAESYMPKHVRRERPTLGTLGIAVMPVHALVEILESGQYMIE